MATPTADTFIAALRQVENDGNVDALAALYATDARTSNPEAQEPQTGVDGARHFWDAYHKSFTAIHSRFHTILESENKVMLEWTSDCETAAGVKTSYDGVSVFETRDGKITRFTAYFDPAELSTARGVDKARGPRGDADAGAYGAAHGGVESGAEGAREES
ncbi:MAG: nuclear transport factor 2 family protein [Candidatus Eremiobacteraeota bacterium]|nr:nuclear transport factor 2 family protein [Candidatus Eremiobacteraeota bacterium]